jgi:hypothetical protein
MAWFISEASRSKRWEGHNDDASRYCEAYRCETFDEGALSALGTRIDAVQSVACSLYARSNETPFITNSKKAISFAMRLLN